MGYASDTHREMLGRNLTAMTDFAQAGPLLTVPEAAAALRVSRSSIYRLFESGELSWVLVCSKRRVSSAEILRFIAAHTEVA